jgi:hypothetical protein
MLVQGTTWKYGEQVFTSYGHEHSYITLVGDTLLNDNVYSTFELKHSDGDENLDYDPTVSLNYFLRESDGVVYSYNIDGDQVVYDFNLSLQDTFLVTGNYGVRTLVVTDTMTFYDWDNEPRRQFRLENISDQNFPQYENWVEGIGSLNSFRYGNIDLSWPEYNDTIFCYYRDGEAKLSFGEFTSCGAIPSSTKEFTIPIEITLLPNPAYDDIVVTFAEHFSGRYLITDLTGRLIEQNYIIDQSKVTIDISTMNNGLYLVRITDNEGRIKTLKFTVMSQ